MKPNHEKLKKLAKDLRREEPRHASQSLAGFQGAARCLDKCRASLLGWQGDYTYGCPLDQMFFDEAEISRQDFEEFVASGASDREVEQWLQKTAAKP